MNVYICTDSCKVSGFSFKVIAKSNKFLSLIWMQKFDTWFSGGIFTSLFIWGDFGSTVYTKIAVLHYSNLFYAYVWAAW